MDIIPRNEWCPLAPNGTPGRMDLPAPRVWLHHGAVGSSSITTAISYARHHMVNRGWQDIGYSFIVAEGKVLEGRGPGRIGAHTRGDNDRSHGICIAGNYSDEPPSDTDLDALLWLLHHGTDEGWWSRPQLTGGHRDAPGASTSCPGGELWRLIPALNAEPIVTTEDDMPLTDADLDGIRQVVRDELRQLIPVNVEDELDRLRVGLRRLGDARKGTTTVEFDGVDVSVSADLAAIDFGDEGP